MTVHKKEKKRCFMSIDIQKLKDFLLLNNDLAKSEETKEIIKILNHFEKMKTKLEEAKKKGIKFGRKRNVNYEKILNDYKNGFTKKQIKEKYFLTYQNLYYIIKSQK